MWGRDPDTVRFAALSCSNFSNGAFGAYARAAEEDLDFWVHLGDYIYEYDADPEAFRRHTDLGGKDTVETLAEYRGRHAQYKLDPALQELHAAAPVIHVPDDHEVENNHAGLIDEDDQSPAVADFAEQRANAYQAMWEHLPYAWYQRPRAEDMRRTDRAFVFGDTVQLCMLDTRQYRTDQPQLDGADLMVFGTPNPDGTLLGDEQEAWLLSRLRRSSATWNVLGQQVVMTQAVLPSADGPAIVNADAWDGYPEARARLLGAIEDLGVSNLVVLSGDIHSSWVSDLAVDFADVEATRIGTEFTCTSVTSNFPGAFVPLFEAALEINPNIRYFNGGEAERDGSTADEHHGYHLHTVTNDAWRCDIREVADIVSAQAPVSTVATFVVAEGSPGAATR